MHLEERWIALGLPAVVGTLIAIAAVVVVSAGADVSVTKTQVSATTNRSCWLAGTQCPGLSRTSLLRRLPSTRTLSSTRRPEVVRPPEISKAYSSGEKFTHDTCAKVIGEQDSRSRSTGPRSSSGGAATKSAPARAAREGPAPGIQGVLAGTAGVVRSASARTDPTEARLVTVRIEPPGRALAARNPSEKDFLPGQTLLHRPDVVNAWNAFLARHKGPKVFSISIDHLVCHDAKSPCDDSLPNGETARPDGVHYSTPAQRLLARPIFEEAWRAARTRVRPHAVAPQA